MYELQYERDNELEESVLIFQGLPEEDSFEEEMLGHNVIAGMLPMRTLRIAGEKLRRYRTDGCSSLQESLLGRKLTGDEFRRLMTMIFACVAEGKKYLLREESYVLKPDCIFVRNDTGTPELVYCPEYEKSISIQLRELSDWFLIYIDSADSAAVFSGYAFHIMSHESGSTMQRILGAISGEQPQISTVAETPPTEAKEYREYAEPAEITTIAGNGSVSEVSYGRPQSAKKKKGIRGWLSFFGGLSVLFGLLLTLLWAIG